MRTLERRSVAITADADGIAVAQALVGADDVALNGAAVVSTSNSPYLGMALLVPARRVTINSVGDDSGITFTIYGRDRADNRMQETFVGGNAGAVTSNYVYKAVERIAASGATAGNITVGWGTEHIGAWILLGQARSHYNVGWQLDIDGTVECDVERTYRNVLREKLVGDYDSSASDLVTAQTADAIGALETPIAAIRLVQNSGAGSATLRLIPSSI